MNNILHIEDHPKYNRDADVVGGRPLNVLDMASLLLYRQLSGTSQVAFWSIVSPDGTKRPIASGNEAG